MGHFRRLGLNLALVIFMLAGPVLSLAPKLASVEAAPAAAAAGPQISITSPAAGTPVTIAEGDDYAKTVLGDAWDMNEITDIRKERSFNMTDVAVSSGVLSFKSGTDDSPYNATKAPSNPQVVLLYPGYVNPDGSSATQNIGKLGVNYQIDATKYKQLSFRMYLSSAIITGASQSQARVVWTNGSSFVPSSYSSIGVSAGILVYEGWHTYSVDLSTIALSNLALDKTNVKWGDTASGGTSIKGLRLDATSDAGVTVMIDWVRLTADDTSATTQTVNWTRPNDSSNAVVNLKIVTDTATTTPIYSTIKDSILTSGSSSYNWGAANLPPGSYYVKAEIGTDWATMSRGDAWDMSQDSDVYADGAGSNADLSFASGVMTGVNKDGDPSFQLGFSPSAPIPAATFNKLSFKLTLQKADYFQIFWVREGDAGLDPVNRTVGPFANRTTLGTAVYSVDLSSKSAWSGNIMYLRIDPIHNATAGEEWQVDWVALDTAGVTRTDEPSQSTSISTGTVSVNDGPNIVVTKPSMTTGEDFASSVLYYPWDMNDVECVLDDRTGNSRIVDIGPYDFTNGILNAVTKGTVTRVVGDVAESDNQLWLTTGVVKDKTDTPIDTSKFKYLTWRFWQEGAQNTTHGWISRLAWWNQGFDSDSSVTKDIVIEEGWNTYKLDMSNALIEPVSTSVPSAHGWNGQMKYFRFDPNEIANSAGTLTSTFHLDYMRLTAPDVAYDSFDIQWAPTGGISPTVTLYYDSDTDARHGKTEIASGVEASAGVYNWNASAVPEGTYYIYAQIQDAYNSSGRYSESPVIVKRAPSVAFSLPASSPPSISAGEDYSSRVLGDPWDLNATGDIHKQTNISGSASNGLYSGTSTTDDPQIELVNFFETYLPGQEIDASKYKKLSFQMRLNQPGLWQVIWTTSAGQTYNTAATIAKKGWNNYTVDLGSQTGWSGTIKYLRLDPVDQSGVSLDIRRLKLTDPSSSSQQLSWSTSNLGDAKVSLYYDTNNAGYDGTLIADGLQDSSYTWDTSPMSLGAYYVYAVAEGGTGPEVHMGYASVPVNVGGAILTFPQQGFLPALFRAQSGGW